MLLTLLPSTPAMAAAPAISATLDGSPISVARIADYQCHDLRYPVIRCFRIAADRDADADAAVGVGRLQVSATTAVAYVTAYDLSSFGGSSITISQDYDALAAIGWNDRVSSFKGRNSETGKFTTDWFGGGSSWNFCCNQQTANLSTYDNTFSAVYRT